MKEVLDKRKMGIPHVPVVNSKKSTKNGELVGHICLNKWLSIKNRSDDRECGISDG
jgi:hypothetical protein